MALNFKLTQHKIIGALVFWQFISVTLMAVGTWSWDVAILNTALIGLYILTAKPYHSVLLLVLSIPFFVAIPNTSIEGLPMWRVLFLLMFVVWIIHLLVNQRRWLSRVFAIQRWQSTTPMTGARLREIVVNALKRIDSRFMPWDKVAVLFLILSLFSLLIARFPMHGFKQILFLLNIYIFYIVIINVVTDYTKVKELVRYTTYSLLIMVGLGFVQYIATLFSDPYYFWQYWAMLVSSLYYGNPLGNILTYSNSWFSSGESGRALRMFGILPDTHAFGVMCIFLLAYLAPIIRWPAGRIKEFTTINRWPIIAAILLAAFAVMASGTRGVWVAMLAPIVVAVLLYARKILMPLVKTMLAIYAVIVILFVASPFITQGLNYIRSTDVKDDFLNRAGSIYDLSESSNMGRLEMWQNSIKFAMLHPFGVGYGNFIVSVVDRIPDRATFEEVSAEKNLRYNLPQEFVTAHSLYLQLIVELGFAGLLAFILFWWEYFERLYQFLKRHLGNMTRYGYLTVCIALAMVWILAYGAFDLTILNDRVLQYLFVSLAVSGLIFAKYDAVEPEAERSV